MALLKTRNNRRSSSPSYVSTLLTLAFIALCVFGVWMLNTGYSFSSESQSDESATTTRTAIDTSESTDNDFSTSNDSPETTTKNTKELVESTNLVSKTEEQKDTSTPVYGDNPGHLPEDAIKSDEKSLNNDPNKQLNAVSDSQISEESSLTQKEVASAIQESNFDNNEIVSEFDKVQQSSIEASEENKKDEEENTKTQDAMESQENAAESQEQSTAQQQQPDVSSFDTQGSKNDEDEANKEQLREDKGENEEQQSSQLSKAESEKNNGKQSEETVKPKAEKKGGKSKKSLSTQADQLQNEKMRQKGDLGGSEEKLKDHKWYLCNVTAGADYIPCLDNEEAIKKLRSTKHFEHRERHCPEVAPACLVPLPKGYKTSIKWPTSRDKVILIPRYFYGDFDDVIIKIENFVYENRFGTTMYRTVKLAEVKGHQNWVKLTGEFLTFPGGGTQFIHGALHYIDFLQQAEAGIAWGKHTRVILDVGCGVGSFGGYLFDRDVIAMSLAPKDEHEAQVQFALERGIPAISAVMGSQRLPFPNGVFDLIHCARCRVPWHLEGGKLLLELNRVLRPGGYFAWSATPVYQKLEEDVQIWKDMSSLTKAMCWELVTINKDELNKVGAAIYRKPTSNDCYEQREKNEPPLCKDDDDPNAAWYVPLQACMHKVPVNKAERGARWPEIWPRRLHKAPYWLNNSQVGIYGKPASKDFVEDTERWKNTVDELSNIGVTWSNVRNAMDMRAVYGGFAAALRELPIWVFNIVNIDAPDTLPIIYERGLFGIYHDWCESFSTYPRTYDLLHADKLFSKIKERCKIIPVIAEVDRIARPGGMLIVRDEPSTISEVETSLKSLHWEIIYSKEQENLLCAKKGNWRPNSVASS